MKIDPQKQTMEFSDKLEALLSLMPDGGEPMLRELINDEIQKARSQERNAVLQEVKRKRKTGLAFSSVETKRRVGSLGGNAPHKSRGRKKLSSLRESR